MAVRGDLVAVVGAEDLAPRQPETRPVVADEQITVRKQRKIVAIARVFLTRTEVRAESCRFDVVTVSMNDGQPRVQIIRNAFDAE